MRSHFPVTFLFSSSLTAPICIISNGSPKQYTPYPCSSDSTQDPTLYNSYSSSFLCTFFVHIGLCHKSKIYSACSNAFTFDHHIIIKYFITFFIFYHLYVMMLWCQKYNSCRACKYCLILFRNNKVIYSVISS